MAARSAKRTGYHPRVRAPGTRIVLSALLASLALAGSGSLAAGSGRDNLDVSGSVSFDATQSRPDVATGLTTTVSVDTPSGATEPTRLSRLQITLPDGFALGAQARTASGNLSLCDPAAFQVNAASTTQGCPAGTAAGHITIKVPDDGGGNRTGLVYAGTPTVAGGLPSLFVEASLGGSNAPLTPRTKLVGSMSVGGDGRLAVSFDAIPAVSFSTFDLDLDGGAQTLLQTPGSCGPAYAGVASLTSAASGATASVAATVPINDDCARPGFAPAVSFAPANGQAGAQGTTTFGVSREDRTPRIRNVDFSLPSGFLANIGGTPECPLTGDSAAGCPYDTQIATVQMRLGVGASLRNLGGVVYLTPRAAGAVAGIHIVTDVRVGDLDLGNLVIGGRVDLRPTDAGLDVSFDLPSSFHGLSLDLRSLALVVDRGNFALNPSSCGPIGYSARVTADSGSVMTPAGQVTYGGCDGMPFAPTLQATLAGETQPLGHPNVSVALNARAGDSNLRGATVTLPKGVVVDLRNITNVCPMDQFNAVTCSAATRVGTATARVAVTPEPIPGDVYLVRIPGQQLPGLGLSFTGRFAQRVLSTVVVVDGRIVVRFDSIPDLPLRRLDMDVFGGAAGPIQIADIACPIGAVWDAAFLAQGRQVSSHTIPAPCAPREAKRSAVTLSSTYGLTWRVSDLGGRSLQSAKLTLPQGFAVIKGRASRKPFQVAQADGGVAKLSFTSKAVILTSKSPAKQTFVVRLKAGSIGRTGKVKKGESAKRVKIKIRLAFTDGTVQNQSIGVRAK